MLLMVLYVVVVVFGGLGCGCWRFFVWLFVVLSVVDGDVVQRWW